MALSAKAISIGGNLADNANKEINRHFIQRIEKIVQRSEFRRSCERLDLLCTIYDRIHIYLDSYADPS